MSESIISSNAPLWHEAVTASGDSRGQRGKPDWTDAAFFLLLAVGAAWTLSAFSQSMDYYEKLILCGAVAGLSWMAWLWRPLRTLMIAAGVSALFAIWLYSGGGGLGQGDITRAENVFFLKYLFSSQSAILWMCSLFVLAMVCYWVGIFSKTAAWLGTVLTWSAVYAGVTGLLVRWQIGRAHV